MLRGRSISSRRCAATRLNVAAEVGAGGGRTQTAGSGEGSSGRFSRDGNARGPRIGVAASFSRRARADRWQRMRARTSCLRCVNAPTTIPGTDVKNRAAKAARSNKANKGKKKRKAP